MRTKNKIPEQQKKKYRINNGRKSVIISEPAFIMVEKDERFDIEIAGCTLKISNSKVIVHLWLDVDNMHITIF